MGAELFDNDLSSGRLLGLEQLVLDHHLIVVNPAHFEAVVREQARVVSLVVQGEVRDLSFAQSADEGLVLSLQVPLDDHGFAACRKEEVVRHES